MEQTKASKKSMCFGIFFALVAITFGLVYYFGLIKDLDLLLAVSYVLYFVGLAFVFNGTYCKETGRQKAKHLNYIFGTLLILGSAAVLIYGFCLGTINLF